MKVTFQLDWNGAGYPGVRENLRKQCSTIGVLTCEDITPRLKALEQLGVICGTLHVELRVKRTDASIVSVQGHRRGQPVTV